MGLCVLLLFLWFKLFIFLIPYWWGCILHACKTWYGVVIMKMWSWVTFFDLFWEKNFIFFCSSTFCKPKQFFCLEFHFVIKIKVVKIFISFLLLIFWNFFIHIWYVNLACFWLCFLTIKGFIRSHVNTYCCILWNFVLLRNKMCYNNLDRVYFGFVIFTKTTDAYNNY